MRFALELMIGFSVGMALLLALAFAGAYRHLELPWQSRIAAYVMLIGLAITQVEHAGIAAGPSPDLLPRRYVVVLFLQSLGFYWLLLGVLRPVQPWRWIEWALPALAIALAVVTPVEYAIPLALTLGTAAAAHLGVLLYRLRALRRWFALELKVIVLFAAMGLAVAVTGLLAPRVVDWQAFAWVYAGLIAAGFFLVGWLLLAVPDLTLKTKEAVASSYAQSTLGKVDQDAAAARLQRLFEVERIYENERLSLARVAELLDLSTHQLSELINTRFGVGFSRFVRQYRIEAAKRMLVEEPNASVLSVGMSVGFNSQSSFYVAFKEQAGMVPGQYRQQQLGSAATPTG